MHVFAYYTYIYVYYSMDIIYTCPKCTQGTLIFTRVCRTKYGIHCTHCQYIDRVLYGQLLAIAWHASGVWLDNVPYKDMRADEPDCL